MNQQCEEANHEKDVQGGFCITCNIEILNRSKIDQKNYEWEGEKFICNLGIQLYQFEMLKEAIQSWDSGIQMNMNLSDICDRIGDALRSINKEQEAYKHYREGFNIRKKTIKLLQFKSESLLKLKRDREALECEEQIQRLDNDKLSINKGVILQNLGMHDEALITFDQMLNEKLEKKEHVLILKARTLHDQQRFNEALAVYEQVLKVEPQNAVALNGKGAVLKELNKYEEALLCFEKALEINPQFFEAWNGKGNILQEMQRFKEASQCYEEALKINPNQAEILNGNGNTLKEMKKFDEALQCYESALVLNPKLTSVYNGKGGILKELKRYNEALQSYEEALKINPQYAEAINGKAIILQELGRYNEAIQLYDQVLQIKPEFLVALHGKGISLHLLKKYNDAIFCFNQILKINPQYVEVWSEKGSSLMELNKFKESLDCFEQAIKMDPFNDMFHCNKGLVLSKMGRIEEALKSLEKGNIKNYSPEFIYLKACTLFGLGRFKEAQICLDDAKSKGYDQNKIVQLHQIIQLSIRLGL